MTAPKRKATADDLRTLYGEDSRWEVIHGELAEKAMPRTEHARTQFRLPIPLGRRFDRKPGGKWPGGWWLCSELHVQYESEEVFCHDTATSGDVIRAEPFDAVELRAAVLFGDEDDDE